MVELYAMNKNEYEKKLGVIQRQSLKRINEGIFVPSGITNMLIHEFALVALLFLHTISGSDCQWCNTIEFWSSVVCSIENFKILNFHNMLDSSRSSIFFERCFETLIYTTASKCGTTIVSRTYMPRNFQNSSFVGNDMAQRIVERPSIWKITSGDTLPFRKTPSAVERSRIQSGKAFGGSTWNLHVILARDIRSFDQISQDDSKFEWNPQDRFIVLIAFREEYGQLNSNTRIDDILRTLWSKHKVQSVLVSETIIVNDTTRNNAVARTYNPFAKVNDSAWGKVEIINMKTVEETSDMLSHIMYRRMKNLNGYELRVGIFNEGQTITNVQEVRRYNTHTQYSDIFKGFDEIVLNTLAKHMNFKAKQIYPMNNITFGHRLSNGTYVGAIGDVIYGRTDICFESFFVKKYNYNGKEDVDFTMHVDFDRVCMIVPKALRIPKWRRIFHFFPLSVWICTMMTHVLTYIMWYILQIFIPGRTERIGFFAIVYRSFLLNVGCPQKLPNTNAERILLSGILLANVTIMGIFSGILYNSFAHDMYYPDINNLHDLDASGLPIALGSIALTDLLGSDDDPDLTMRNLNKKLLYNSDSIHNAAYHRNASGFSREHHFSIITEELIDADGRPLLHLVKQCLGAFYLSYLLPKNSILRERINVLIGRLGQAGLSLMWKSHTVDAFIAQKRGLAKEALASRNEKEKMNAFVPFNLSDVQTSFYMLLIGLLLSTIAFFYEKGWLKASALLRTVKSSSKSTL